MRSGFIMGAMRMMGYRVLVAAGLIWSCTPTTSTEESEYQGLTGTWAAREDTSIILTLTRACCGSKARLEGSLARSGAQAALDPTSYVYEYPIQLPDSARSIEFAFELVLAATLDPICAVDGFIQDKAGARDFPKAALPDSAVLVLAFSSRRAGGCDSLWKPMIFERKP
jgi:hypothetical protein